MDEQKEVEDFVDDQLAKGYICPSISPQTSPVFFVPNVPVVLSTVSILPVLETFEHLIHSKLMLINLYYSNSIKNYRTKAKYYICQGGGGCIDDAGGRVFVVNTGGCITINT